MATSRRLTRKATNGPIASREASLARTSVSQDAEPDSQANAADSGESLPGSFAWFDPVTSSWRMYQGSLFPEEDRLQPWPEFSETWPRAGMMRNGRVCQLGLLVPPKPDGGFSLSPTLAASESGIRLERLVDKNGNPPTHFNQRVYDKDTKRLAQKGLSQFLHFLTPTLRASDGEKGGRGELLHFQKCGKPRGKLTPTLTASAADRGAESIEKRKQRKGGHSPTINDVVAHSQAQGGGVLNPTWCEWYMGFPEGWSEIESDCSETASSPKSPNTSDDA